jgi:general secretion pathway protein K
MTRDRAGASTPDSSEQGVVIVAVLWILMALSALTVILSLYLSASAQALAVNDVSLKIEALVSASLELTAYQLTLAGDEDRPQRGSFHFKMDAADTLVTFTSEAARIDLNMAPKELLSGLFAGLGAKKDAADDDAERIIGWRTRPTPDSTNDEEALYRASGLSYSPRQAPFANAGELALIAGLPPALVDRALPFVTVFNGTSDVDRTIAEPEVLDALPNKGSDKSIFSSDTSAAGSAPAGTGSAPAAPGSSPAAPGSASPVSGDTTPAASTTTARSACYRVQVSINFEDGRRTASEAVIVLGNKDEPYRVLSWQDDVQPRRDVQRPRRL